MSYSFKFALSLIRYEWKFAENFERIVKAILWHFGQSNNTIWLNAMNIYNLANIEWSERSEESEYSGGNISNIPSIDPELMLAKMDIEVFQSL